MGTINKVKEWVRTRKEKYKAENGNFLWQLRH